MPNSSAMSNPKSIGEADFDPWCECAELETAVCRVGSSDQKEETMPFPKPYLGHSGSFADSFDARRIVTRSASLSNLKEESTAKELLRTSGMAQSLPNMHSSRSIHNRVVGFALLSKPSESGNDDKVRTLHTRIQEFDLILEEL